MVRKRLQMITVEALIERYSVLLFDASGVLVSSSGALAGAVDLLAELSRLGKPYYIVTNDASKLPETTARRYRGYGLAINPDQIITSGSLLEGYFEKYRLKGARCVVLGPEDSARYVEKAGGQVVSASEAFDVLVIGDEHGYPFLETVDIVLTALYHKIDRQESVHLVLPNPDLVYLKGDQSFGIASGSVASLFEAALRLRYPNHSDLRFERLGKPFDAIFTAALRHTGTRDMVMIGDQLETDIRGANAFGIDSVLVGTGVATLDAAKLPEHLRPTYYMESLVSSP